MIRRKLLLAICLLLIPACTTLRTREYAPGEIPVPNSNRKIVAVTRASGVRVSFDRIEEPSDAPAARIEGGAVVGTVDGRPVRVDLSDTRSVWIEETGDAIGRTLLVLGGVALGTAIVLAIAFEVGV